MTFKVNRTFFPWLALFLAIRSASPFHAAAQVTSLGSLAGVVTDSTGAVLPGAQITITNMATHVTRKIATSSQGSYTVTSLDGGDYSISATKDGFATTTLANVHLAPGQRLGEDLHLSVGSLSNQVTVQADTVAVQTESPESGGTITAKEVKNLMLNGRNFQTLAQIVPGVSSTSGANQLTGGGYLGQTTLIVNGAGVEQTAYTIDGVYDMTTSALININILPTIDSIAEFRVLKDNYSAKYGLAGSGQILVQTKSGGQTYHGTGYDYIRSNSIGTARNFFNNTALAALHQNIFGYTLSGPIMIPHIYNGDRSRKTFFFAGGEWRIDNYAAVLTRAFFPQALRNGDFSASPTAPAAGLALDSTSTSLLAARGLNPATCLTAGAGGRLDQLNPSCFDPTAVALMNAYWPLPNATVSGVFNNYINNGEERDSQEDQTYRIDQSINDNNLITGRLLLEQALARRPSRNYNDPAPNPGAIAYTPALNALVRWTSNVTPLLVNNLSIAETYSKVSLLPTGMYTLPAGATINQVYSGADPLNRIPDISVNGGWSWLGVGAQPNYSDNGSGIASEDVSYLRGTHALQFGALYMFNIYRANANSFPMGNFSFTGLHTGDPAADYLLGLDATYSQTNTQPAGNFHERWAEAYGQDDWQATQRLALSYGVHWTYFSPSTESGDMVTNFDAASFNPTQAPAVNPNGTLITNAANQPLTAAGQVASLTNGLVFAGQNGTPSGFIHAKKDYFAPRVGFAYKLTNDGKTSVHGGYGMGYTQVGLFQIESLISNPPYVQSSTINNGLLSSPTAGAAGAPGLTSLSAIGPDYRAATIQNYSLTFEREVVPHGILTAAYAGSTAQHLFINTYDQNFPLAATTQYSASCAASSKNLNMSGTGGNYQFDPCLNLATQGPGGGSLSENYYRPFPGYASITSSLSGGSSNYNSGQLGFVYRLNSLQVNAAYTYSKALSDVSPEGTGVGYTSASTLQNSRNIAGEYGIPDYDRTHDFTGAVVYTPTYFDAAQNFLVREALSGWNLSGLAFLESGFALTPTLSFANAGLATRPDQVAPVRRTGNYLGYYSLASYAAPSFGFFGDAQPGSLRGPSEVAFNVAAGKNFPIHDRLNILLRAEAFNVLNHPNFEGVDTAFNPANPTISSGFGQATSAGDPRIMEFVVRADF